MNAQPKTYAKRCPHCQRLPLPQQTTEEKVFGLHAQATAIFNRLSCYKDNSFSLEDVKLIIQGFGHKSVISGKTGDLTIKKLNEKNPLTIENIILVTVAECFIGVISDSAKAKTKEIVNTIRLPKHTTQSHGKRKRMQSIDEDTLIMQSDNNSDSD
jgi:hypothetical protein